MKLQVNEIYSNCHSRFENENFTARWLHLSESLTSDCANATGGITP